MIHIAICDDEREFVEHMRGLLERYADETGEEIKITACYDGMELVEKYDPGIDLLQREASGKDFRPAGVLSGAGGRQLFDVGYRQPCLHGPLW